MDERAACKFPFVKKLKENYRKRREDMFLFFFFCFLLTLCFIIPSCVHYIPYGTDVFGHLLFTKEMESANSLSGFYNNCLEKGYLRYKYPFGLWLFGSIVAKVTDLSMLEIACVQPFMVMIIFLMLYYAFARGLGATREQSLLSLLFLLSMPIICMGILGYSTSKFVMFLLISILYLMLTDKIRIWKRYLLMILFIFTLCFSHTGTTMFLFSLTILFLLLYAFLFGDVHRDTFVVSVMLIFAFIIAIHLFPHIHPQYIDKGRILVSVGDFFSSDLHIPFAIEVAEMFYEQIFVNLNFLHALILSLSVYSICKLLILLHSIFRIQAGKVRHMLSRKFFSIPVVGGIRHISHSILYAPFWLGPFHTSLAAIGLFKTNRKGLCLFLSVAAITCFPGGLAEEEGTGALRSIEYFYVIIPILAALGFNFLIEKAGNNLSKLKKIFVNIFLLLLFLSVVIIPVIGNLYYHPLITGADYEREGLQWLSGVGFPEEGCAGYGYRERINIYGNKNPISVTAVATGSEAKRFIMDQYSVCFSMNSEEHARDLYSTFGIKYLIVSERTLRNFGEKPERLMIDYNRQYDKIYSSVGYFSIYKYITSPVHRTDVSPQLDFAEDVSIKDAGDSYLVDTGEYKVRIYKTNPGIKYIGNKTANFLGAWGLYYDVIKISWSRGSNQGQINEWALHELSCPKVILGKNHIIYETALKNENETEKWATLTAKYTFFKKAMRRDIIISNDWVKDSEMNVQVTMGCFSPMRYFKFQLDSQPAEIRTIYPCEDNVPLEDLRFNRIYINNGREGIYIKFENTAPYPNRITYKGFTDVNYSYYTVSMYMKDSLIPSESLHISQWIAIGDEKKARSNIEHYASVSFYPYPEGEIPIILMSDICSLKRISDEDFNISLDTYKKLRELGLNYTEAVDMHDANESRIYMLMEKGIHIIGCGESSNLGNISQREEIKEMKENAKKYGIEIEGYIPKGMNYGIDTIKTLAEQNITFMIAKKIGPPVYNIYFQEGIRRPKMAYYHGERADLVLLPISEPTIPGTTYYYENYEEAWKAVIDSVIENEDLCIFLWDSSKVSKPEYVTQVINTIRYAEKRGMTFTTPHKIVNHFRLMQNVHAVVSRNENGKKITILMENKNEKAVNGVTVKVKASKSIKVRGGKIVRKKQAGGNYIYYVSTDLAPKERKEIILRLSS